MKYLDRFSKYISQVYGDIQSSEMRNTARGVSLEKKIMHLALDMLSYSYLWVIQEMMEKILTKDDLKIVCSAPA